MAYLVTIEPLIHWGTVTPATDNFLCHGRVLAFRRDGEKCDDPLWTQAIKRLVPQFPTTYCSQCLDMMMDWRTAAWAPEEPLGRLSFTAVNDRPTRETYSNGLHYGKQSEELNKAKTADRGATGIYSPPQGEEQKPGAGSKKDELVVSDPSRSSSNSVRFNERIHNLQRLRHL
jgi:hypothetical protein